MKAIKLFSLLLIAVCILSCDIFFAPAKGRFNPADPENDLLKATVILNPIVDGFVSSTPSSDFTSGFFNAGGMYIGLIKFNLGGFPAIITSIKLRLYHQPAVPVGTVTIYRIREGWDPASIEFTQVSAPEFFFNDGTSITDVTTSGYFTWDVRKAVELGAGNGFIVIAPATAVFTSAEGVNKPELIIDGYNYP